MQKSAQEFLVYSFPGIHQKDGKSSFCLGSLIRQTIRRQLGYLKRDLAIIEQIAKNHSDYTEHPPKWLAERLPVIRLLYSQQQEMYSINSHRAENRIVSLSQPWVRTIVCGKQNAEVEFGAKVEISVVNGFLRVEELRWDAFI